MKAKMIPLTKAIAGLMPQAQIHILRLAVDFSLAVDLLAGVEAKIFVIPAKKQKLFVSESLLKHIGRRRK